MVVRARLHRHCVQTVPNPVMRTLVVEDDAKQREMLAAGLRAIGHDVDAVADGDAGLLAILRKPYELLVIDWVMPKMDGLTLCHRVRAIPRADGPYVLVVTGRDRPADLAAVLDAGADDYLAKPVALPLLQTRIRIAEQRIAQRRKHRQAQEALVRSEAEFRRVIQQADRLASVGSLAAGVAHEINNPLAYLIANLELLYEDLGSPPRPASTTQMRRAVREAIDGADRVRRIVGDLKSFSRPEDDQVQAVDVHEVLEAAVDIASNEIRHRAELTRHYGEVPRVRGNAGRLTQVFLNLLVNAAHAINEGEAAQRIAILTREQADGVLIEISDTGNGIAPELVDRVFDPFFTTKPQGMGTGLGLSICHGIIAALDGEIRVDTAVGEGSTFRVLLRKADAQAPARRAAPGSGPVPQAVRALRILVVDDEPLIGEGIRRALRGHHVEIARGGREAIDRCEASEFDLVLCDVMMPEVSGMEVYGKLQTTRPGLEPKFVFMTGGAFTPKARVFLESVEAEHLEKPFSVRELRRLVNRRAEMH